MKVLQVLCLLCMVTTLGYSCKIRLPDFLEDLFRNEDKERQSGGTDASDRSVVEPFAVFTVIFLTTLVVNVVRIVNNHQQDAKLETEETLVKTMIDEVTKDIFTLEEMKDTANRISNKITEITSTKNVITASRNTHRNFRYSNAVFNRKSTSCSDFTDLCKTALAALVNGKNVDIPEINYAIVDSCSSEEVTVLQSVNGNAAYIRTKLIEKIEGKQAALQILLGKLNELNGTGGTEGAEGTEIMTTPVTSVTTTTSTITSSATGFRCLKASPRMFKLDCPEKNMACAATDGSNTIGESVPTKDDGECGCKYFYIYIFSIVRCPF